MIEIVLDVVFVTIVAAACLVGIAHFWHWFYGTPTDQDETFFFETEDGWRLALHRYRAGEGTMGLPVILCHGLSSNRYVFDMPSGSSLARFLRAHGRDVWVPELRGSGMSQSPGIRSSDVPYSWAFEDHLNKDVPAIVSQVIDRTAAPAVHWVGHSMGGLLVLAHLARNPGAPLASAMALGSPADFSQIQHKSFDRLLSLRGLIRHIPVFPLPFLGRLLVPVAHAIPQNLTGLFNQPNTSPAIARRILALASQVVTSTTLWLDFGRFLSTGRFAPEYGVSYLEGIERVRVPLFLASGAKDLMAPPDAVDLRHTCAIHGEPESMVFGKASGCSEDYGHMDLLVGVRSEREVFPRVLEWLAKHESDISQGK